MIKTRLLNVTMLINTIHNSQIFVAYKPLRGATAVFGTDELWEQFITEGIHVQGQVCRMGVNATEICRVNVDDRPMLPTPPNTYIYVIYRPNCNHFPSYRASYGRAE